MVKYAILAVEWPQDQAFVSKVLKVSGFKDFKVEFKGLSAELAPFWRRFIPIYPKKGNLYQRLDMPSILFNDNISVAIYAGEGSNLIANLADIIDNHEPYQTQIFAFGIIADCDRKQPDEITKKYYDTFHQYFPNFPQKAGIIDKKTPNTGIYILPDNNSQGVLETLLYECGQIIYPEYMQKAIEYIGQFSQETKKQLKWKPFDEKKAIIATVVSILKPGKTNTVSIADNQWISEQTKTEVENLAKFIKFLQELLMIIDE